MIAEAVAVAAGKIRLQDIEDIADVLSPESHKLHIIPVQSEANDSSSRLRITVAVQVINNFLHRLIIICWIYDPLRVAAFNIQIDVCSPLGDSNRIAPVNLETSPGLFKPGIAQFPHNADVNSPHIADQRMVRLRILRHSGMIRNDEHRRLTIQAVEQRADEAVADLIDLEDDLLIALILRRSGRDSMVKIEMVEHINSVHMSIK
ncbi:hypothetical protein D3C75_725050 [compost metagenome]